MFKSRLTSLLIFFAVAGGAVAARLTQLQLVDAADYRTAAAETLRRRPQTLPFVRGRILDRLGQVLAADEATWDVCVDYAIIAAGSTPDAADVKPYLRIARAWPRFQGATDDQISIALQRDVEQTWRALAAFDGVPIAEIHQRRDEIHRRVQRIREIVAAYWQFVQPVREEREAHPLVAALPESRQIDAREAFAGFAWVDVRSSSKRLQPGGAAFTHLVGRVGPVDQETLKEDPSATDPFARYLATDVYGVTGVERIAEQRLRGRRGQLLRDRAGEIVESELSEPENGEDVRLTVRTDLQKRLFGVLAGATHEYPRVPGGAIVVLHVPTRDVLAMVSYPAYDAERFSRDYNALRDDTVRTPLRFRAASNMYAPGSIIKPLVCLAGLGEGRIDLGTRYDCRGYLYPDHPDAKTSRCWEIGESTVRQSHGPVDVIGALRGSCNIFMYHLGMELELPGMAKYYHLAGLGAPTGVGLREEALGRNPDPYWMAEHDRVVTNGILRLLAMGQGDLMVTPLQAANLMATYAEGQHRPLRLLADRPVGPATLFPVAVAHWAAVRQGMYEVVNDPGGTAFKHALLDDSNYVLCGKTGSATTHPRPIEYAITFVGEDGRETSEPIPAGSQGDARQRYEYATGRPVPDGAVIEPTAYWPPGAAPTDNEAHAWFGGFLQPAAHDGRPDWRQPAPVAFAVLLEYGYSGGRASGPVGRRIAQVLIDTLGPALNPDAPVAPPEQP